MGELVLRRCPTHQVEPSFAYLYPFFAVQLRQLPAATVGVAVGLVAGVGVAPGSVVGVALGLAAGTVGVSVAPVVGTGVGSVAGTVGVAPALVFCVLLGPSPLPLPLPLLFVLPALKVALMATPLSLVVTAMGSGVFSRPTQFSPL